MRAVTRHAALQRGRLLDSIRRQCGGVVPKYHINFARNFALWNGTFLSRVSDVPGLTGTLNLGPGGHTIAALANGLAIPITLPYPHSGVVAWRRGTDSGLDEDIHWVSAGATDHYTRCFVDSTDQGRLEVATAGAQEASLVASAMSVSVNVFVRSAYRVGAHDVQAARAQNGGGVVFSTADTLVTEPNAPDTWFLGVQNNSTTSNFRGTIHSASLVAAKFTDGNIAAACAAFN